MKQKQRGMTLIALVVTIIILLILAGMTISKLTGSGLFEKAKKAENKTKEAQMQEYEIINGYSKQINNLQPDNSIEQNKELTFDEILNDLGFESYTGDDLLSNKDGILEEFLNDENGANYIFDNSDIYLDHIKNDEEMIALLTNSSYAVELIKKSEKYSQILSESDYWQTLYTKCIPVTTENETDIGIATVEPSVKHGYPYYAFDNVFGAGAGVVCGSSSDFWVQYQFKNESDYIVPKVAWFYNSSDSGYGLVSTGYFSASMDGENYDILANFESLPIETKNKVVLNSTKQYKYFRCTITEKNNTYSTLNYRIEFNVYGL